MMREKTMFELLKLNSEKFNINAKAIDFLGNMISYKNMFEDIDKVASYLRIRGIKNNDTVTICLPNIPNAVVAFYAVNKLGAVANIVHPLVPTDTLIEYMELKNSKCVFLLDTMYEKNKNKLIENGITAILCDVADYLSTFKAIGYHLINAKKRKNISYGMLAIEYSHLLKTKVIEIEKIEDNKKCSVLLHSGGTTGSPKTVELNDFALNNLAMRGKQIIGLDDVEGVGMLAVLPIFHGFGLCMGIHTLLVNGGISVLIPFFNEKMINSALKRGTVRLMAGVPTMYAKLLASKGFKNKGIKNLIFAFCGGDSMPNVLKEQFDKFVRDNGGNCVLSEGYGLTEAISVVAVNDKNASKDGSVGKVLDGLQVVAVREGSIAHLNANECGELCVCGDTIMLGYCNDKKTTDKIMKMHEDKKIWIHTGDYGCVDEDGFVFFKQRIKRIIKVSGVAVFPSEIEDFACKIDEINACCAVGVEHHKTGHIVKLYVELKKGIVPTDLLKTKIKEFLKSKVVKWGVPNEIEFVQNLPRTMVGKVDFKQLAPC